MNTNHQPSDRLGQGQRENGQDKEKQPRQSAAEQILTLVKESNAELFHDAGGTPYMRVKIKEHLEVLPIESMASRKWIRNLVRNKYHIPIGNTPLETAVATLAAEAECDSPKYSVYVRMAEVSDGLCLHLGDDESQVVKISPGGCKLQKESPVRFRRWPGMLPLPVPEKGGDLLDLKRFVNIQNNDHFALVAAWLVQSFFPQGPFPILCLHGEQGSAKSTFARILKLLVDPHETELRTPPRDLQDLAVAANNSWVLAIDNVSSLSQQNSDGFCRLSTGASFTTRKLYTDGEETRLKAKRPVILNGINDLGSREDLMDRSLVLGLSPILESNRRTEEEVLRDFFQAWPHLLGSLLDAVAGTLRELPKVHVKDLPRMAGFYRIGVALGRALGWHKDDFPNAYRSNMQEASALSRDASVLYEPICKLLDDSEGRQEWTFTELLKALEEIAKSAGTLPKDFPNGPSPLSRALNRLQPALRKAGIIYRTERQPGKGRGKVVYLYRDC